jgi:TUG ubiquitin-like domain
MAHYTTASKTVQQLVAYTYTDILAPRHSHTQQCFKRKVRRQQHHAYLAKHLEVEGSQYRCRHARCLCVMQLQSPSACVFINPKQFKSQYLHFLAMSSLTILWSGRRKTIKVSANAPMSSVLAEGVAAHGLGGTNYSLYYPSKRTTVDLSTPFRLSGVPQNTTLELKEAAAGAAAGGSVRVGVKLSTGEHVVLGSSMAIARARKT